MDELRERIARLPASQRAELERRLLLRSAKPDGSLGGGDREPGADQVTGGGPRVLPASYAQRRLWFLAQLEPDSSWYNIPMRLLLRGALDVAALERSLARIVARHEVLRTTFVAVDGEPQQVVAAAVPVPLPVDELLHLPPGERRAAAEELARREARRPFDLQRGPLLRARLWRIAEDEHLLLVSVHHILFDGWSGGIFSRELSTCYAAFARNSEPELPALTAQYGDYTRWQRQQLDGSAYAAQLDYWRARLADAPARLELPTDKLRPRVRTARGASHTLRLPTSLAKAIDAFGREEGATLFMTVLAAFQTLLGRYSGSDDIVVGAPIAGRTRPELEPLIGLFLNAIVLRTDVSGDPSFRTLLRRVREVALGAYAHQDIPFEKLVEELQPERFEDRSPIFQVMFTVQNTPRASVALSGLRVERMSGRASTSKFDLTLSVFQRGSDLTLHMEYSTDLFEAGTIARMLRHLQTLLDGVMAAPDRPLSTVPLAAPDELRGPLSDWNATDRDFPGHDAVHRVFERRASAHPQARAITSRTGDLRYGELNRRANQLARYLLRAGVTAGERVAVGLERSPDLAVALLAVLKAGAAYVPLDPSHPPARLRLMMEDAGVGALITAGEPVAGPPPGARLVRLDRIVEAQAREPAHDLGTAVGGHDLAYVMYTSGSTGRPKGIMVPHRAVLRLVCNPNYVELTAADCVAQVSNASFDAATFEFWGALLNGARLVILDREVTLSPQAFAAEVERHNVTTAFLTTALLHSAVDLLPSAFSGLRTLLFGGESADVARVRALLAGGPPARLVNVYGPTETTTFATWHPVMSLPEDAQTVPIGRPISNTRTYVLDDRWTPVPVGVPGELWIGGPGVAWGYLGAPALTAERFVPDPFGGEPGARLYRTGDRVRWRADGTLEFLGRLDHQVKLRGFRVEPSEIESVLAEHPGVRQSLVTVREDVSGDRRLVAYVVPRVPGGTSPDDPSDPDHRRFVRDIRSHLRTRLPAYMVPASIVPLAGFPLSPNGKVDRRALPVPEPPRSSPSEAPREGTETILAAIWRDLLGAEDLTRHDNFFDRGGHSLLAVKLFARMEQAFGLRLPLATLFQAAELAQLARALDEAREQQRSPGSQALVTLQPDGGTPAIFLVHDVDGRVLCYRSLVRHLGTDRPIYGFELPRDPQGRPVMRSIEELGQLYAQEMRAVQPEGPYLLGGYCWAGGLAFEVARQVRKSGGEVAMLALIESTSPNLRERLGFRQRMVRHLTKAVDRPPRDMLTYLGRRVRNGWARAGGAIALRLSRRLGRPVIASLGDARTMLRRAMQQYRPAPYAGPITLFKVSDTTRRNRFDGWDTVAQGEITIVEVAGRHLSVLDEPDVAGLAERLGVCLENASGGTGRHEPGRRPLS